jgi:ABC-type lipoprotein export system ATPase subunit
VLENTIIITSMYFKKKKNKEKSKSRKRWNSCNSRQKRKARRETISEAQRLAIVNAVLSKKRLLIYSESL